MENQLRPHHDDLEPRSGSKSAVEPIAELTKADEAALRRRYKTAPAAVLGEVEAMGVLYRAGERFPYWPKWLDPQA